MQDFALLARRRRDRRRRALKPRFEEAFAQIWAGAMESDGFNRLILLAGLDWRAGHGAAALRQGHAPGRQRLQPGLYGGRARASPGDRGEARRAVRAPLRSGAAATAPPRPSGVAKEIEADLDQVDEPRRGPHPPRLPDARRRNRCAPITSSAAATAAQALSLGEAREPRDRAVPAAAAACARSTSQPAHGRRASARRQGRARRHPLVRPQGGFPHRDPGPDEGADGEERGHRADRLEGRLRRQAPARAARRAPGRRGRLLHDLDARHARPHRQYRRRQGRAAQRRRAPRRRRSLSRRRRRQGHRDLLRHRQRHRRASTASGSATPSPRAARTATTTRRWASPRAAPGSR